MMTLAAASSYFDRTEALDAYTGASLFLCQIDPYDDSKRDAMVAYRRVLSVAAGVQIPAHRVISIFGAVWMVAGEPEIDGLAEVHRIKYVLQMADGKVNIGSLTQFLDGVPATTTFGFPGWVKDAKQIEESSDVTNLFEIILPLGTEVLPKQVIWRDGVAYLALSSRRLPSDFVSVNAVRLDQAAPLDADLQQRIYSPATGAYVLGEVVYRTALRVRWQSLFQYDAQMAERFQEGDFTLVLPEETDVSTSTRITFEGLALSVLAVMQVPGGVAVHVRKA